MQLILNQYRNFERVRLWQINGISQKMEKELDQFQFQKFRNWRAIKA